MASDLRPLEIYSAGGIDQSEKPRPDSVQDACNIDTSKGLWAVRPGWMDAWVETHASDLHPRNVIEYIPDRRYNGSRYYCVIYIIGDDGTGDPQFFFYERHNSEVASRVLLPQTDPAEWQKYYTMAKGLWRNTDAPDSSLWYVPTIVFSNGEDRPLIYHQVEALGKLEYLDSVDGGDESLTYLDEPPRAKVYCMYKGRLFAFNIKDEGGNVGYNTGLYEFATYVCNVWPASYNFSIGIGSDIVGARVLNDVMYIFKKGETWALSGDGIDGNWQMELVDSQHGAFSNDAIVETGDALILLDGYGEAFWRFDGNGFKNISHPRLQHLWKEYEWAERNHLHINGEYDEAGRRVMFVCGQHQEDSFGMLVYNLATDTWDRWGDWPGKPPGPAAWNLPYAYNQIPQILFQAKKWYNDRPVVMGMHTEYGVGNINCTVLKGHLDSLPPTKVRVAPHWYIRTHKYFEDNSYDKMLEQVMVYAKMTGDWELTLLALKDDETLEQAIRRGSKDQHNLIADSADAVEHVVIGDSQFLLVADGPVDLIYLPTLYKLYDSKVLVVPGAGGDKIKFAASLDTTDMNSLLMVLKEDKVRTKLIQMYEDGDPILGAAGMDWGDIKWKAPQFKRLTRGENVEGRCFSLYLSNVGSYYDATYKHWAAPCSGKFEMKGWGLWVRRHGVMTQQKRTFEMPSY